MDFQDKQCQQKYLKIVPKNQHCLDKVTHRNINVKPKSFWKNKYYTGYYLLGRITIFLTLNSPCYYFLPLLAAKLLFNKYSAVSLS